MITQLQVLFYLANLNLNSLWSAILDLFVTREENLPNHETLLLLFTIFQDRGFHCGDGFPPKSKAGVLLDFEVRMKSVLTRRRKVVIGDLALVYIPEQSKI